MPRKYVDAEEALNLYANKGWPVQQICAHFSVKEPAIYRAFHKLGYMTFGMGLQFRRRKKTLERREARMLPPGPGRTVWNVPPKAMNDIAPIPTRDPCPRCGVRKDIGCRHNTERLGWCCG